MRSYFLLLGLLFGVGPATWAQTAVANSFTGGDAAVVYQWARSNTQPGDCGCFRASGLGVSGSLHIATHWAAVAEVSADFAGKGPQTGNTLTLASFLAGARYRFPRNSLTSHPLQPYLHVLLGAAHAGGGIAGAGDGTVAFAARVGGGVEVPLTSSFAMRLIEADYFPTDFANAVNGHQNNVSLASGIVYQWSNAK